MAASAGDEARQRVLRRKHLQKAMEHAFDNELEEFRAMLEDPKIGFKIDPELPPEAPAGTVAAANAPPRENSFLGEASCGNAIDVVKYLLEKGADPNYVGEQRRTPLHRALNNDAIETVPILLAAGADPRLLFPQPRDENDPSVILFRDWDVEEINGLTCCKQIKDMLRAWPIDRTIQALRQRSARLAASQATVLQEQQQALTSLEDVVATLSRQVAEAREAERGAFLLREERIKIYDMAKGEGRPQSEIDIQHALIKQAEELHVNKRMLVADLEHKLKVEKAKLRETQVTIDGGLKYLCDLPLKDVEDVLAAPGLARHPYLACDVPAGIALSFMLHRGHFLVKDIGNSTHLRADNLLHSLLTCLRYGRSLVVNVRDRDLINEAVPVVQSAFEAVQAGLWAKIADRSIVEPTHYRSLLTDAIVRATPEFDPEEFSAALTQKFVLCLLTSEQFPPQGLLDTTGSCRIIV